MILFEFNSQSSGRGVLAANQIAYRHGGVIIKGMYKVKFESPTDPDLESLYRLVKSLKGTSMALENGDIVDPAKLFYAVSCERKIICKGMCTHVNFGDLPVDKFIEKYSDYIEDNVLFISREKLLLSIAAFLERVSENEFKIKKSEYLEYFQQQGDLEKKFCPSYNLFEITEEINNLPDQLLFMEQDDFEEKYSDTRREEALLRNILKKCTIDSALSTEDILIGSKALSLLSNFPRGNLLQDNDIFVYSFPFDKRYILLRFIEQEKIPDVVNGEITILTKCDSLFCIKNSEHELYFQIFEEDSALAEQYLEVLKSINNL